MIDQNIQLIPGMKIKRYSGGPIIILDKVWKLHEHNLRMTMHNGMDRNTIMVDYESTWDFAKTIYERYELVSTPLKRKSTNRLANL